MDSAPAWVSYVALATGLPGLVVSVIALRHAVTNERRKLRLELRTEANELNELAVSLKDLLHRALKSRVNMDSAKGLSNSGAELKFKKHQADDLLKAQHLETEVRRFNSSFSDLGFDQLESALIEVRSLTATAAALTSKYAASLDADDAAREAHLSKR